MSDETVARRAGAELARDSVTVHAVDPITDDSPGATLDDDALNALLERLSAEPSIDDLMAINAALAARGIHIYNSLPATDAVLIASAAGYATVFMQTLAKHNAEALIKAVRTRFRRMGKTLELVVGTEDDAAAAFVVTGDLSDDAMLAMLDVDVTSDEMRGKVLRWDEKAMAWRPDRAGD